MGFNFSHVCHLAKLNKANPLVFLDGDMQNHKAVAKLKLEHSDVAALFIDKEREFEQVVPISVYIAAVVKELDADPNVINVAAFEQWRNQRPEINAIAFSKQVEHWIANVIHQTLHKPQIMFRAITDVEANDIDPEPFRLLVAEVRRQLGLKAANFR
jgi:hypothetical protein